MTARGVPALLVTTCFLWTVAFGRVPRAHADPIEDLVTDLVGRAQQGSPGSADDRASERAAGRKKATRHEKKPGVRKAKRAKAANAGVAPTPRAAAGPGMESPEDPEPDPRGAVPDARPE